MPAQERRLNLTRQLMALDRRVAMGRRRSGGAHDEATCRIEQGEIGIVADCDVSLGGEAEAPRWIPGRQLGDPVLGEGPPASLAEHARQKILGSAEARFRGPDVVGGAASALHLGRAARVIAHDPVDLALEHALPEILDVLARADRGIDLGVGARRRVAVEQQVADGHFATEVDVGKDLLGEERRLEGLA